MRAATPALRVLSAAGVAHELRPYAHAPGETGYGEEAVAALRAGGVEIVAEQVFKTLVVDVDGSLVVTVVPVPARLDLKALAAVRQGRKAQLADPGRVGRSSGYVLGGVSPLGQKTALPTVVDESASLFPTILVSAGRRGLQVQLDPADLVRLTGAVLADIAR